MDEDEEDWLAVETETEGDQDLYIASREFEKIAESRNKSGFVEGAEAGKTEGLKEGFSAGFVSGLSASSPWAILKGRADALKVYYQMQEPSMETYESLFSGVVTSVGTEEAKWRPLELARDLQACQEEVAKSLSELTATDDGDATNRSGGGVSGVDPVAMDVTSRGGGVSGVDPVAMDMEETPRSGAGMTYGELVASMDHQTLVQSLKLRLQPP